MNFSAKRCAALRWKITRLENQNGVLITIKELLDIFSIWLYLMYTSLIDNMYGPTTALLNLNLGIEFCIRGWVGVWKRNVQSNSKK